MVIVRSHNRVPIRLTSERWTHITDRHPEMESQQERVLETIAEPDMIQEGDFDALLAIRLYSSTPLTRKYLVVAYREATPSDGFVLTAYLTRRPSTGRAILWKR